MIGFAPGFCEFIAHATIIAAVVANTGGAGMYFLMDAFKRGSK